MSTWEVRRATCALGSPRSTDPQPLRFVRLQDERRLVALVVGLEAARAPRRELRHAFGSGRR
jgi:hypothetical protein